MSRIVIESTDEAWAFIQLMEALDTWRNAPNGRGKPRKRYDDALRDAFDRFAQAGGFHFDMQPGRTTDAHDVSAMEEGRTPNQSSVRPDESRSSDG